jgi:hypothetical protein
LSEIESKPEQYDTMATDYDAFHALLLEHYAPQEHAAG